MLNYVNYLAAVSILHLLNVIRSEVMQIEYMDIRLYIRAIL